MTTTDIAHQRLINQQIIVQQHTTPKQVVAHMGAIQAQDYAMAKWAIGLRLPDATDAGIEQAIDNGQIIRIHLMRPTWHFVSADDVRWMLQLTAPNLKRALATQTRLFELDDKTLAKANKIIGKLLQNGQQLTRPEIMLELEKKGVKTNDLRSGFIMFHAELNGLVCNGSRKGKQFTYALLNDRVPPTKPVKRDEALAKLALRYFESHGPATLSDYAWWSGLSLTDARKGLEMIKSKLFNETIGETVYWFSDSGKALTSPPALVYFLPAFDEFLISYKDRSASLAAGNAGRYSTNNGIFKPTIIDNGKVTGTWQRTISKGKVLIETHFFDPANQLSPKQIEKATQPFRDFLQAQ
jgi:hypothetical protein